MRRLTILAKGNADVRDSLHGLFEDGTVLWNGLNTALRERGAAVRAHVVHEIGVASPLLLAPPAPAPERTLPLGLWTAEAQRRTRLFDGGHDAVVLSIQPDVTTRLARHRGHGGLLYPHDAEHWPDADRAWLTAEYAAVPPLAAERSMANLAEIVARLRQTDAGLPILIFNLSPVLGWERVHSYHGLGETLGERIRCFNLALIDLSRGSDISIVDVETIVARAGAARMKRDAVTLTAEGCRAVAEAVADILGDHGLLAGAEPAA